MISDYISHIFHVVVIIIEHTVLKTSGIKTLIINNNLLILIENKQDCHYYSCSTRGNILAYMCGPSNIFLDNGE